MTEDVPGYRVLEKTGESGAGVVYRAHHERLGRQVALKVLSAGPMGEAAMARFRRECGVAGPPGGHPNVATVLEAGTAPSGRPYVAMEYFEHGALADRIGREGPLPVPEVLRIGVKTAGALAAAHEAGVLHLDVTPQSILMSRHGEPALAGFGVARLVGSSGMWHPQVPSPHHTAPEVLEGGQPSVASDVYSLGSTLYQLLAGTPAFQGPPGEGVDGLMSRVLHEPLPVIRRADVPAPVFEAIGTAMAKVPEQRFASATAFARRLRQLQSELGLPVTDPVEGPVHDPAEPPQAIPSTGGGAPSPPSAWGAPAERNDDAEPQPPETAAAGGPHSRTVAAVTVVLVGGLVGGIVVAGAFGGDGGGTFPQARASTARKNGTPSASPSARTLPPIPRAQILAAAPRLVRLASDQRTSVVLRWWLPAASRKLPILVRPAPWAGRPAITAGNGATGAAVRGLRPGAGYCFRVGAVLRGAATGRKPVIAWSKPLCIRGARPR
ncbi:serine/threonine-protein kinase [Thermomonospora echinospora]|nr:serine/threonine-protein kinase [Thermomonospora echinospora]